MRAIRARVRGGRLTVDAPTDLPEGLEARLAVLDDDERDALGRSIEESYGQAERGELVDARGVIASLRAGAK